MNTKLFSSLLIAVGILVAASPVAGQLYTRYHENRMLEEWQNSDTPEEAMAQQSTDMAYESYARLEAAFSRETGPTTGPAPHNSGLPTGKSAKLKPAQKILGVINIPKIKVKSPIVEGVEKEKLRAGIGHIPGTAGLGQMGNTALAGHRSYTFGRFFNRLDELVEGDEIVVSTKKADYRYKVYEKKVVEPKDVSVLKFRKNEQKLTLITCTPIYASTHRLIIHAILVEG